MMQEDLIEPGIARLRQQLGRLGIMSREPGPFFGLGFSPEVAFDLFISKSCAYAVNDDSFVGAWLEQKIVSTKIRNKIIPLKEVRNWRIDTDTGNISHESGRFFSVIGLKVRHREGNKEIMWDQPIIDQPEVGMLGILAKKFCGILHFCLQAKEEPGNINLVQLSPTVQATYSNYTMAHGGKMPPFIELFLDPPKEKVIFSKLQAEDGGRFLYKSNKNIVMLADDGDLGSMPDNFIWLTLRQISELLKKDNIINSCARSVLANLI